MATFIVKYTITNELVAIVEATDETNAKLLGTDEGLEVGNVITNEYSEGETITPKQIDQVEYQTV